MPTLTVSHVKKNVVAGRDGNDWLANLVVDKDFAASLRKGDKFDFELGDDKDSRSKYVAGQQVEVVVTGGENLNSVTLPPRVEVNDQDRKF